MADDEEPRGVGRKTTPDEILKGIIFPPPTSSDDPEKDYIYRVRNRSINAQVAYEHLRGIRDHYRHKTKWSYLLMAAIAFMIAFQSYILWKVGKKELDFSEYEWLLPALLVQNLGQVVGLAVYAVRYLFSDISNQKAE